MYGRTIASIALLLTAGFCVSLPASASAEPPAKLAHVSPADYEAFEALAAKLGVKTSAFKVDVEAPAIDTRVFPKKKLLQIETGGNRTIRGLWVVGYPLENLDEFAPFGDLETLVVVNCGVNSVGNLGLKNRLKKVVLMKNKLESTAGLDRYDAVEHVDLRSNRLSTADELGTLAKSREIFLDNNRLSALPNLSQLTLLRELRASGNEITELDGATLPKPRRAFDVFESVNLSNNKITSVANLESSVVRHIDLANNRLSAMPAVGAEVNSISLRKNKIRRAFSALEAIEARQEPLFVDLRSNPLGGEKAKLRKAKDALLAKKITLKL